MEVSYERLLAHVARLYERHEAAREGRTSFNVFDVLRSPSDEVNLHSRFLHALLDHRETVGSGRENLRDFLTEVARVEGFRLEGVGVSRETDNIDLLISNGEQAVVMENKIWAGDQERQLQRYHCKLRSQGYDSSAIHIRYLTLFGDKPSGQSIGDLPCETLSYKESLPPWLKRCAQRAFENPALRESIAQYLQLIRTLTGTDYDGEYMAKLKRLCLKADNMVLAHDLSQAFVDAKVDLVVELWSGIDNSFKKAIRDLRDPDLKHLTKPAAVRDYISGRPGSQTGLYYRFAEDAWLAVVAEEGLWFGVYCEKDAKPERYRELRDALSRVDGGESDDTAPWYQYSEESIDLRNLNHDGLRLLMSEKSRSAFAKAVSAPMKELWRQIKRGGLADGMGPAS